MLGAAGLVTPAFNRSRAHSRSKAGFLTCRSSQNGCLPISFETVTHFAVLLAAYSGGTVRDSNPLPFSLAFDDEYPEHVRNSIIHCLTSIPHVRPDRQIAEREGAPGSLPHCSLWMQAVSRRHRYEL